MPRRPFPIRRSAVGRRPTRIGPRLASLLAVLTLVAAPVVADTGDDATPRVEGAHPAMATGEAVEPTTARPRPAATPLTRAAVRARIAGIDPGSWLARYGAVDRRPTGEH